MMSSSRLSGQQGASITGVMLLLIGIVVFGKLLIAIIPAQIGDYQLTKMLSSELIDANANNVSARQFVEKIDRQLSINADYDTRADEIFRFTNKKTGQLAIHKEYEKTSNFFGNVYIVNRFDDKIPANSPEF